MGRERKECLVNLCDVIETAEDIHGFHVPYLTVHETLLDDRIRGKYDCLRHQNQRKLRYVRHPCACAGLQTT